MFIEFAQREEARQLKMNEVQVVRVDDINFELSVKDKKPVGQAVIDFTLVYDERSADRQLQTKIPLDTIWVDREKRVAIKSHMRISTGNALHRMLFAAVHKFGYVRTNWSGQFLTADRTRVIRFGPKGKDNYSDSDAEFNTYYAYDSYVQTLRLCMDRVSQYKQVGGLEAVSLRHIGSEVLVEFGFEEIKDFFGVGPSMWRGNADLFLRMRDGYVPHREIAENATAFLEYVKVSLNE